MTLPNQALVQFYQIPLMNDQIVYPTTYMSPRAHGKAEGLNSLRTDSTVLACVRTVEEL